MEQVINLPDTELESFTQHIIRSGKSGCLSENTKIITDRGIIEIKDLNKEKVLTYNFKEKKEEYKQAIKIDSGKKQLYLIELENNKTIKATKEHIFFVKENNKVVEKRLLKLKKGDKLVCR